MNEEWFINLRNLAFLFATLMLVKYFIFLVIAPFYSVKEELRKIKLKKRKEKYNPLVSVIVPAWNEEVGIKKTIKSLIENTHDRIEIIIVNDGSTDNSDAVIKDIIEKTEGDVRYKNIAMRYFYKENGGKGTALNLGIEKSKGEIIVTMDADSAFEKNTISNFVEYFTDKNIDAAVGNVKIANKRNIIGLLQRLEYLFGFYYKRTHAVLGAEYIFGGACAAFRREIFDNLGYFDIGNKTEDIEMSMRVRFHGLRCAYAEKAVCWTEGASTIMGLINQRLRWKKGRLDTFIRYRKLFFSFDRKHNKALTFFVLPFSLLAELQLLYEPIAITLLLAYSFISGDFISLALGSLFIFVIYFVVAFFNDEKIDFKLLGLFFFTWSLFYILVWIKYLVLIKSLKMVLRGEDVSWQKWKRVGIDNI